MVNIKLKNNTINVMQDTALLDDSYSPYIDQIKSQVVQGRDSRTHVQTTTPSLDVHVTHDIHM